ncbi:MAG TPA: acylneuraminate cytidylyltransferase family protein [bacterium]|nr:acylneuraminate cytidylyltransferase family protein [bacterium]
MTKKINSHGPIRIPRPKHITRYVLGRVGLFARNKKIIAIIPARGSSKGLPRKNIRKLAGKPLIAYTIEAALKSKYLDRIIVSTDDKEIAKISQQYGAEVPFMRPKELAKDEIPLVPIIPRYVAEELEKRENYRPDIVLVLQPTCPLRGTNYIDLAIEKLIKTKCDWVVTVVPANPHPFRARLMKGDKLIPLFEGKKIWVQRQDFPPVYQFNGAIYATWRKILQEKEVFQNKDWRGVIMKEEEAVDIDTIVDFLTIEAIIKRRLKNKTKNGK